MCSKFLSGKVSELVGYTYPKLHKGKEWYVDFYARDPAGEIIHEISMNELIFHGLQIGVFELETLKFQSTPKEMFFKVYS